MGAVVSTCRYIVADVFDGIASLPDASVDLVVTSPPYVALRSYLPADHPAKHKEIGSEPTPAAFIDTMLDLVEALDRVLAPHGSICIELGDTFSGSGGAGGDYGDQGLREGQPKFQGSNGRRNRPADVAAGLLAPTKRPGPAGRDSIPGWPLAKSLCMVPELFRVALAYGMNPLTGRQTPPWRCRNVVRHFRPNPPVGALGDKFRPATSDWIVATKSATRFFDLDAVRTEAIDQRVRNTNGAKNRRADSAEVMTGNYTTRVPSNPAGAPPLDWWADDDLEWRDAAGFVESTFPYAGPHFATFSPKVVQRLIEPMCPQRVCRACGEPSRRITETVNAVGHATQRAAHRQSPDGAGDGRVGVARTPSITADVRTLGWSDCGCPWDGDNLTPPFSRWRPGLVLDPFGGSGTTGMVAIGCGRDAVLIDIDERNADLARERVGMFLDVHHLAKEPA
jgi:hypothetical protein